MTVWHAALASTLTFPASVPTAAFLVRSEQPQLRMVLLRLLSVLSVKQENSRTPRDLVTAPTAFKATSILIRGPLAAASAFQVLIRDPQGLLHVHFARIITTMSSTARPNAWLVVPIKSLPLRN